MAQAVYSDTQNFFLGILVNLNVNSLLYITSSIHGLKCMGL